LLYVAPPASQPSGDGREQLERLRALASILGTHLLVEESDDLADTAAKVARESGTTYVFMGQPRPRRGLLRLSESLPERLLRKLPGVDVRMVSDARD
ncbi:MAG TPA: hypothetical protein VIM03_09165, partial [Thermoleophilaceae bacterium]